MPVIEERVSQLEPAVTRLIDQTSIMVAAMREDVAEIRVSNARTDLQLLQIQQQADRVACLNREKLYGIAMGAEAMEVVNLGRF